MIYFDLRRDGGLDARHDLVRALALAERQLLDALRLAEGLANPRMITQHKDAYKALRDMRMHAARDLLRYREIAGVAAPMVIENASDHMAVARLFSGSTWSGSAPKPLIRCAGAWFRRIDGKWRRVHEDEVRGAIWMWLDEARQPAASGRLVAVQPNKQQVDSVASALRAVALREDLRAEIHSLVS